MRNWLITLIVLPALTAPALANDPHDPPPHQPYPWAPDYVITDWHGYSVWPPGTHFQKQVVSGYHPHWYPAQVPTVVPKITYKVETQKVTTFVHEAKEVNEKQKYLTYTPVPRLVERPITTFVLLPLLLADPAGLPMITCRVEVKEHKVKYTVYDYRPVEKETVVKVTRMVPTPKVIEYRQAVPIVIYTQEMTTEWHHIMVPYQRIVDVPVIGHSPQLFWP